MRDGEKRVGDKREGERKGIRTKIKVRIWGSSNSQDLNINYNYYLNYKTIMYFKLFY